MHGDTIDDVVEPDGELDAEVPGDLLDYHVQTDIFIEADVEVTPS